MDASGDPERGRPRRSFGRKIYFASITVDPERDTPEVLKRYAKTPADSLKLPYPLLSDFPHLNVIRSYGVLSETRPIVARRSFFLVDMQGILRQKWLPDETQVFPSETILAAVRALTGKS